MTFPFPFATTHPCTARMTTTSRRPARRVRGAALLSLLALAACEGSTGAAAPPRLSIQGARDFNALGDTATVTLVATDEDGQPVGTSGAVWTSSNPQVAAAPGLLPAIASVGVGTATISVTLRGATATAQVEVRQVPARVRVTAPGETLAMGATAQLTGQVVDSLNAPLPAQTLQWESSLPEVGAVSQTGVLTGLGTGRTRITARGAGVSGATDVLVVFTGEDNWAPDSRRVRVSFAPAAISLAGADSIVTATITAQDEGRGIGTVAIRVGKETPVYACTMTNPTTGSGQRGTWTCPIRRGVLAGAGRYRIHELAVFDTGGNGFTTYAENLEAGGRQAYFTVNP